MKVLAGNGGTLGTSGTWSKSWKSKESTRWVLPSSATVKSSRDNPRTGFSLASVTTTSRITRCTFLRKVSRPESTGCAFEGEGADCWAESGREMPVRSTAAVRIVESATRPQRNGSAQRPDIKPHLPPKRGYPESRPVAEVILLPLIAPAGTKNLWLPRNVKHHRKSGCSRVLGEKPGLVVFTSG